MSKMIPKLMGKLGYTVVESVPDTEKYRDIQSAEFWDIYRQCQPFTMTSVERMYSLYCSVLYVLDNNIPGAFVECGVWRGGSSMLMAFLLKKRNVTDRRIYLYDTFEGMSAPTGMDKDHKGAGAAELLNRNEKTKEDLIWCLADLADVQNNFRLTGLPGEQVAYVKGKVEETIPSQAPGEPIALLRLDTDWYESTRHELIHLYPKLQPGGVLIIDDYGHWEGCRKAVDEYFTQNGIRIFLNRIDYTGRVAIKTP